MKLSLKMISANLLVYGITHAVIDWICAAVIFSIFKNQTINLSILTSLVILYNVLAFWLQAIFGLITDYLKSPKETAILGCIFVGISAIIFLNFPISAIIFAWLGNALFHVGGGSISLNLTPQKTTAPGIYVAPGALGLFLGIIIGKSGQFIAWQAVLILIILSFLMVITKKPNINYTKTKGSNKYLELIILLILLSIAIRSLVGFIVIFPWKSDFNLLIALTIAIVLGKGLGGILADKFGWIKISVWALILSIPLLSLASNIPILAIIGMFLFNITMPVTLVAISNTLPGRSAFAFGLTCLALIIGISPIIFGLKSTLNNSIAIFVIIFISSIVLYKGLKLSNIKQ